MRYRYEMMTSYYQSIIPDKTTIIAILFIIALVCSPLFVVGAAFPADEVSEASAEEVSEPTSEESSVVVWGIVAVEVKADVVESQSESLVAVDETVEVAVEEPAEDVVLGLMPQTFSASKVNSIFLASHSSVCLWIESTT